MAWFLCRPAMLQAAEDHYRREQRAAALGVAAARRVWRGMSFGDLTGSWVALVARMVASVSAAQFVAVRIADSYASDALLEQGLTDDPVGDVAASELVGLAGDGRDLDTLLYGAVVTTKEAVAGGADEAQAMLAGRSALDLLTATAVQDAGRAAEQVAMASRRVTTYVRMVNLPACSRCVILAGSVYRTSQAFLRHPKCDCRNIPSSEDVAGDLTTNPRAYFKSLSRAEQDRTFTAAGAESIRLGADMAQVVNARRGAAGLTPAGARLTQAEARALRYGRAVGRLRSVRIAGRDVFVTTEGTTTRGLAGQRLGARETGVKTAGNRYRTSRSARLMPESILAISSSPEESIRLLRRFGYIT